jgi:hypothetical protein
MRKIQPLTSEHRATLAKWHDLIYINLKFIFAFVNSVLGGLYRTLKGGWRRKCI